MHFSWKCWAGLDGFLLFSVAFATFCFIHLIFQFGCLFCFCAGWLFDQIKIWLCDLHCERNERNDLKKGNGEIIIKNMYKTYGEEEIQENVVCVCA